MSIFEEDSGLLCSANSKIWLVAPHYIPPADSLSYKPQFFCAKASQGKHLWSLRLRERLRKRRMFTFGHCLRKKTLLSKRSTHLLRFCHDRGGPSKAFMIAAPHKASAGSTSACTNHPILQLPPSNSPCPYQCLQCMPLIITST